MPATVVLVRHAEALVPTPDGPGQAVRPLTERGRGQAEALVGQLQALAPAAIFSSPYRRAIQTVEPVSARLGLPVQPLPDLREWHSGLQASPDFGSSYRAAWRRADLRLGESGETLTELDTRVRRCLRVLRARAEGSAVLAATHGTWLARALSTVRPEVDADFWLAMPMPAVFTLRWDESPVPAEVVGPGLGSRRGSS